MVKATRRSMFTTHRGRKVVRGSWVVVGGMVLLWGVSHVAGGGAGDAAPEQPANTALMPDQLVRDPGVAPPLADPFKVGSAANLLLGEETAGDSPLFGQKDPLAEDAGEYQAMLSASVEAAQQFGTYSWRDDPQEWVAGLTGLSEEYREALAASVDATWADLTESQFEVRGMVVSSSPRVIEYVTATGQARVAVTVTQEVTRRGVDTPSVQSRSFAVSLTRAGGEDEGEWLISNVTPS